MYGLAAPIALVALPLGVLLLLPGARGGGARLLAGACLGFGLWWLLGPGEPPDQVMRAAALIAALGFAALSRLTRWSVTHRALAALTASGGAVAAGSWLLGWSWVSLHWWITTRTLPTLRLLFARAVANGAITGPEVATPRAFEGLLEKLANITANLFPASLGLQLYVGLVIAAALAARLIGERAGVPPTRLADFRFTDHLGWLLLLGVIGVLVPGPDAAKVVGLNLLLGIGTLYGLRGLAVIAYGIRALRGGVLLYLVAAVAVFFVLPGVVLLGVLDAGLNLRRRFQPSAGA